MSTAIREYLALAKTPEEREEMKERLLYLMEMRDEDIDYSDIPPIRDFSRFVCGKPIIDAMRERNRRRREERERKAILETQSQPE